MDISIHADEVHIDRRAEAHQCYGHNPACLVCEVAGIHRPFRPKRLPVTRGEQ
jgi:hypothetical protein